MLNLLNEKLIKLKINYFFHFTHIDNLQSIIDNGILPKNKLNEIGINPTSIANEDVQAKRDDKYFYVAKDTKYTLHDLVPLYFSSPNPMLSAIREVQQNIVIILIKSFFLNKVSYAFTDGNAASDRTKQYWKFDKLDEVDREVREAKYWNDFPDGTRKRCAECLIYPKVDVSYFWRIDAYNDEVANRARQMVSTSCNNIEVTKSHKFFI